MTDPYRDTDPLERTGLPRWVKVAGITVAVLVLLVVVMMLAGGGGGGHIVPDHSGGDADATSALVEPAGPGRDAPPGVHG